MKTDKDQFATKASQWDQDPMKVERAKIVANQILKQVALPANCKAMEFGCGTGLLGFNLLPHLGSLDFCDISEAMLEQVKVKIAGGNISNASTLLANLSEAPLDRDKYDLIFSLMTLHHIPDLDKTICKLSDMLLPGGILCIADLDEDDGSFHRGKQTDHHGINQEMLMGLFRKYGIEQIKASIPYRIKKEQDGAVREYPVFLMTGIKSEG